MLYSPAKILLAVYFVAQTFFGYTQQVPIECTDDIAEQLTARLDLFLNPWASSSRRCSSSKGNGGMSNFSTMASITRKLYLLTVLLATVTQTFVILTSVVQTLHKQTSHVFLYVVIRVTSKELETHR